jgi:hypothetical protein
VNPLVYGFMSENFRKSFKTSFSGMCRREVLNGV